MTNTLRSLLTLLAWPTIVVALVLSTGCAARQPAPRSPLATRAPDIAILLLTGEVLDATVEALDARGDLESGRAVNVLAARQARLAATVASGTSLAVLTARGDASLVLTERAGVVCARFAPEQSDLWWECVDGWVSDYCNANANELGCEQ